MPQVPVHPHDPLLCGLLPSTSCPECRRACWPGSPPSPHDLAMQAWEQLTLRHPRLQGAPEGRWHHPDPLTDEDLSRLVWTLLSPTYQHILRPVLLALLRDHIADAVAVGVAEAMRAGRRAA